MTEKQAAFITSLKAQFAQANTPALSGLKDAPARCLQEIAFLRALPTPTTAAEASAQIDALKSRTLTSYARAHAAWAQAVLAGLRVIDPATIPGSDRGAAWTTAGWTAYVAGVLA